MLRIGGSVLHKSSVDPAFRALALKDGSKAVEQVLGFPLPDGLKIRFVENDGAWMTLGLPPARTADELSDRDLEAVAGGRNDTQVPYTGDFGGLSPMNAMTGNTANNVTSTPR
jgi:hypothetical protein